MTPEEMINHAAKVAQEQQDMEDAGDVGFTLEDLELAKLGCPDTITSAFAVNVLPFILTLSHYLIKYDNNRGVDAQDMLEKRTELTTSLMRMVRELMTEVQVSVVANKYKV